jgi:glycerol-3-phosphate dehydrogenase
VLVQSTLWGNLILGPTARDTYLPEVMAETNDQIMTYILQKCRQLVPGFDATQVFHGFWGSRAKSTRGDWILEPSKMDPHFIHAAGIDSPGLAGSPAIAVEIVRLLAAAGLTLEPNKNFNPIRAPIIRPKNSWKGIRAGPVGKYTNPNENVVCKCEKVTEAEVVEAIHRSLPIDSTQAIRKRTRAGMGDCQGKADNYDCECRVAQIIARETGLPIEAVGRRPWPATSTLPKRWLDEEDKQAVDKLSK